MHTDGMLGGLNNALLVTLAVTPPQKRLPEGGGAINNLLSHLSICLIR